MTSTAPTKPTDIPDGSVWDADQQLWVGPQSEFAPPTERERAWVEHEAANNWYEYPDTSRDTFLAGWDAHSAMPIPQSEFERGVRAGVANALAFFKDENGHAGIPGWSDADLDQVEATAVDEVLRDAR